uniref:Uncharacterized protein n=2 Tax=Mucochytrium quahogii TaxID=96639 RepID=A0A7S2S5L7_9STRA|mmetsp:Transcript_25082/g.54137  ORF Transcript_25082/g.54137 Transcript_25082/m.54137 type:complete len:338 (+) Transcript_25082:88-1101(+)
MSNVDFVRAMSKLVTRIGVSSLIPDSSIRMLAQHYASPQINGVQQVDYISFCRAFHASSVHVVNEEILLQSFANSVGQTSEKYGMSYLDCMKNRDDENYGFISRYDFRRAVRHDMGIDVPEADLLYLMDLADTQGDGTVDYVCLSNKLSISSSSNTDRLDPSSKQMLRRLKERITSKMPPSFDLRNVFSYYSNGEPFLTSTQLSQLGSSFGLHLPPRFCSGLCEQGRMYLPAFLRMLDQDEEEWDAIAEKCWDSLLRLERQQQSFSEMCSIYEDPESTTRTIRASDFRFCVSNAGLPLSQYEFDLVRNRFRNEKCGTIDYLGFVEFVRCRSLQLVSF